VITADGGLLTFGSGISGQLGQDNTQNLPLPVPVPELMGTRICGVACGSAHTLVVTVEGRLLSFGWGHFGQLGIGSSVNSSTPVPVTTLEGHRVVKIACGSAHSVACTDNGRIFTWGWGVNGQLGHGDDASLLLPSPVKKLESIYISQVSCGLAHTVAISQVRTKIMASRATFCASVTHPHCCVFAEKTDSSLLRVHSIKNQSNMHKTNHLTTDPIKHAQDQTFDH
jgi:alpha-tubulin suppressor-like RCC1 family protein